MSVRSSLGAFHSTSSPKLTERRVRDKKTASNSASRLPLHERIERVLLLRRQGEQDDQSLPPRSLDITGSDPRYKSDTYASNYQQLHDSTSDSEAAQEDIGSTSASSRKNKIRRAVAHPGHLDLTSSPDKRISYHYNTQSTGGLQRYQDEESPTKEAQRDRDRTTPRVPSASQRASRRQHQLKKEEAPINSNNHTSHPPFIITTTAKATSSSLAYTKRADLRQDILQLNRIAARLNTDESDKLLRTRQMGKNPSQHVNMNINDSIDTIENSTVHIGSTRDIQAEAIETGAPFEGISIGIKDQKLQVTHPFRPRGDYSRYAQLDDGTESLATKSFDRRYVTEQECQDLKHSMKELEKQKNLLQLNSDLRKKQWQETEEQLRQDIASLKADASNQKADFQNRDKQLRIEVEEQKKSIRIEKMLWEEKTKLLVDERKSYDSTLDEMEFTLRETVKAKEVAELQCKAAEEASDESQNKIKQLRKQLNEEKLGKEFLAKQVRQVTKALKAKESKLSSTVEELSADREISKAESEAAQKEQKQQAETHAAELQKLNDSFSGTITGLENKVAELEEENNDAAREHMRLTKANKDLEDELLSRIINDGDASLKIENAKLKQQLEELREQSQTLEAKLTTQQTQLVELGSALADATDRNERLLSDKEGLVNKHENEAAKLSEQINSREELLLEAQSLLKEREKALQQQVHAFEELRKEYADFHVTAKRSTIEAVEDVEGTFQSKIQLMASTQAEQLQETDRVHQELQIALQKQADADFRISGFEGDLKRTQLELNDRTASENKLKHALLRSREEAVSLQEQYARMLQDRNGLQSELQENRLVTSKKIEGLNEERAALKSDNIRATERLKNTERLLEEKKKDYAELSKRSGEAQIELLRIKSKNAELAQQMERVNADLERQEESLSDKKSMLMRENASLYEETIRLKEGSKDLRKKCSELSNENRQMKEAQEVNEEKDSKLSESNQRYLEQITELAQNLSDLEELRIDLETKLEVSDGEHKEALERLHSENAQVAVEKAQLDERVKHLEEMRLTLEKTNTELSQQATDLESFREENARLTSDLALVTERLRHANELHEDDYQAKKKLLNQSEKQSETIAELNAEKSQATIDISLLSERLKNSTAMHLEASAAKKELIQRVNELTHKLAQMTESNLQLQSEVHRVETKLVLAKERSADKNGTGAVNTILARSEEEKKRMMQTLADVEQGHRSKTETLQTEVLQLKVETAQLGERVAHLEDIRMTLEENKAELMEQLSERTQQIKELNNVNMKVSKTRESAREENARLTSDVALISERLKHAMELNDEDFKMKQQLVDESKNQVEKISALTAEKAHTAIENSLLAERLKHSEESHQQSIQANIALEARVVELNESTHHLRREVAKLEGELKSVSEIQEEQRSKLAALGAENAQLSMDRAQLSDQVTRILPQEKAAIDVKQSKRNGTSLKTSSTDDPSQEMKRLRGLVKAQYELIEKHQSDYERLLGMLSAVNKFNAFSFMTSTAVEGVEHGVAVKAQSPSKDNYTDLDNSLNSDSSGYSDDFSGDASFNALDLNNQRLGGTDASSGKMSFVMSLGGSQELSDSLIYAQIGASDSLQQSLASSIEKCCERSTLLQRVLTTLKQSNSTLSSDMKNKLTDVASHEQEIAQRDAKIERIQDQLTSLLAKTDTFKDRTELEMKVEKQRMELESAAFKLEHSNEKISAWEKKVEQLQCEIVQTSEASFQKHELNEKLRNEWENDRTRLLKKIKDLSVELDRNRETLSVCESKLKKVELDVLESEEMSAHKHAKSEKLMNEWNEDRSRLLKKIKELSSECDRTESELHTKEKKAKKALEDLVQLQITVESLEEERKKLQDSNDMLNCEVESLRELKELRADAGMIEIENNMEAIIGSAAAGDETKLHASEAREGVLRTLLASKEEELSTAKRSLDDLKKRLQASQAQCDRLSNVMANENSSFKQQTTGRFADSIAFPRFSHSEVHDQGGNNSIVYPPSLNESDDEFSIRSSVAPSEMGEFDVSAKDMDDTHLSYDSSIDNKMIAADSLSSRSPTSRIGSPHISEPPSLVPSLDKRPSVMMFNKNMDDMNLNMQMVNELYATIKEKTETLNLLRKENEDLSQRLRESVGEHQAQHIKVQDLHSKVLSLQHQLRAKNDLLSIRGSGEWTEREQNIVRTGDVRGLDMSFPMENSTPTAALLNAQNDLKEQEQIIAKLKEEVESLRVQLDRRNSDYISLQSTLTSITSVMTQMSTEKGELKHMHSELSGKVDAQGKGVHNNSFNENDLDDTVLSEILRGGNSDGLNRTAPAPGGSAFDNHYLQSQIGVLRSDISRLDAECTTLKQLNYALDLEVDNKKRTITSYQTKLNSSEETIKDLQEELKAIKARKTIAAVVPSASQSKSSIAAYLERKKKGAKKKSSKKKSKSKNKNRRTSKKKSDSESKAYPDLSGPTDDEYHSLLIDNDTLQHQVQDLIAAVENKSAMVHQLQRKVDELEVGVKEAGSLMQEAQSLEVQRARVMDNEHRGDSKKLMAEVQELKTKFDAVESINEELTALCEGQASELEKLKLDNEGLELQIASISTSTDDVPNSQDNETRDAVVEAGTASSSDKDESKEMAMEKEKEKEKAFQELTAANIEIAARKASLEQDLSILRGELAFKQEGWEGEKAKLEDSIKEMKTAKAAFEKQQNAVLLSMGTGMESLKEKNAELKENLKQAAEDVKASEKESSELSTRVSELKLTKNALEEDNASLATEVSGLSEALKSLTSVNEEMLANKEECAKHTAELEAAKQEVESLSALKDTAEGVVLELEMKINILKEDAIAKDSEKDEDKAKLEAVITDLNSAKQVSDEEQATVVASLNISIEALQASNAKLTQSLKQTSEEFLKEKNDLTTRVAQLEEDRLALESSFSEAASVKEALEEDKLALATKVEELTSEVSELTSINTELSSDKGESATLVSDLEHMKFDLKRSQDTCAKLETCVAERESENENLKRDLGTVREGKADKEAALSALQEELVAKQGNWDKEKTQLEASIAQLSSAKNAIEEEYSALNTSMTADIEASNKKSAKLSDSLAVLLTAKNELTENTGKLAAELQEMKVKLATAESNTETLVDLNKQQIAELEKAEAKKKSLESEVQALTEKLDAAVAPKIEQDPAIEADEEEGECSTLQTKFDELKTKYADVEEELSALKDTLLADAQEEPSLKLKSSLEKDTEEKEGGDISLKQKLLELQTKYAELETKHAEAEKELEEFDVAHNELMDDMEDLQKQHAKVQAELKAAKEEGAITAVEMDASPVTDNADVSNEKNDAEEDTATDTGKDSAKESELEQKLSELQTKYAELETKHAEAEKELEEFDVAHNELMDDMEDLQKQHAKVQAELKAAKEEGAITAVEMDASPVTDNADALEEKVKKCKALEIKMAAFEEQMSIAEKQRAELIVKNTEWEIKCTSLQTRALKAESKHMDVEAQRVALESEKVRLEKKASDLVYEIADNAAVDSKDRNTLQENHKALQKEHRELQTVHTKLTVKYEEAEKELEEFDVAHNELIEDHEAMVTKHKDLSQDYQELLVKEKQLTEDLALSIDEYKTIRKEKETLAKELDKHNMVQELEAKRLASTSNRADNLVEELASLKVDHSAAMLASKRLEKELEQCQKLHTKEQSQLKSSNEKVDKLNEELDAIKSDARDMKVEKDKMIREAAKTAKVQEKERKQMMVTSERVDKLTEEVSALKLELKEAKKEGHSAGQEVKRLKKALDYEKTQHLSVSEKAESLGEELDLLKVDHKAARKERDRAQKEADKLGKEQGKTSKELQEASQKFEELHEQIDSLKTEIKGEEKTKAKLKKETEKLAKVLEKEREQLQLSDERADSLSEELDLLKVDHKALKKERDRLLKENDKMAALEQANEALKSSVDNLENLEESEVESKNQVTELKAAKTELSAELAILTKQVQGHNVEISEHKAVQASLSKQLNQAEARYKNLKKETRRLSLRTVNIAGAENKDEGAGHLSLEQRLEASEDEAWSLQQELEKANDALQNYKDILREFTLETAVDTVLGDLEASVEELSEANQELIERAREADANGGSSGTRGGRGGGGGGDSDTSEGTYDDLLHEVKNLRDVNYTLTVENMQLKFNTEGNGQGKRNTAPARPDSPSSTSSSPSANRAVTAAVSGISELSLDEMRNENETLLKELGVLKASEQLLLLRCVDFEARIFEGATLDCAQEQVSDIFENIEEEDKNSGAKVKRMKEKIEATRRAIRENARRESLYQSTMSPVGRPYSPRSPHNAPVNSFMNGDNLARISDLEREVETAQGKVVFLEESLGQANDRIRKQDEEIMAQFREEQSHQRTISALQGELNTTKTKLEFLKESMEKTKEDRKSANQLQFAQFKEIQSMQEKISYLERELHIAESNSDSSEKALIKLQKKYEEEEEERRQLRMEAKEKVSTIKTLQAELAESKENIAKLEDKAGESAELNKQSKAAAAELKKERQTAAERIAELENMLDVSQANEEDLEETLEELRQIYMENEKFSAEERAAETTQETKHLSGLVSSFKGTLMKSMTSFEKSANDCLKTFEDRMTEVEASFSSLKVEYQTKDHKIHMFDVQNKLLKKDVLHLTSKTVTAEVESNETSVGYGHLKNRLKQSEAQVEALHVKLRKLKDSMIKQTLSSAVMEEEEESDEDDVSLVMDDMTPTHSHRRSSVSVTQLNTKALVRMLSTDTATISLDDDEDEESPAKQLQRQKLDMLELRIEHSKLIMENNRTQQLLEHAVNFKKGTKIARGKNMIANVALKTNVDMWKMEAQQGKLIRKELQEWLAQRHVQLRKLVEERIAWVREAHEGRLKKKQEEAAKAIEKDDGPDIDELRETVKMLKRDSNIQKRERNSLEKTIKQLQFEVAEAKMTIDEQAAALEDERLSRTEAEASQKRLCTLLAESKDKIASADLDVASNDGDTEAPDSKSPMALLERNKKLIEEVSVMAEELELCRMANNEKVELENKLRDRHAEANQKLGDAERKIIELENKIEELNFEQALAWEEEEKVDSYQLNQANQIDALQAALDDLTDEWVRNSEDLHFDRKEKSALLRANDVLRQYIAANGLSYPDAISAKEFVKLHCTSQKDLDVSERKTTSSTSGGGLSLLGGGSEGGDTTASADMEAGAPDDDSIAERKKERPITPFKPPKRGARLPRRNANTLRSQMPTFVLRANRLGKFRKAANLIKMAAKFKTLGRTSRAARQSPRSDGGGSAAQAFTVVVDPASPVSKPRPKKTSFDDSDSDDSDDHTFDLNAQRFSSGRRGSMASVISNGSDMDMMGFDSDNDMDSFGDDSAARDSPQGDTVGGAFSMGLSDGSGDDFDFDGEDFDLDGDDDLSLLDDDY